MDGLVTAPGLRDLMNQILMGDSELDAFVIDHFPQVQRLYAGSMDRIAKVNLLFERVSFDQIYASLCARYPNAASNGSTARHTSSNGIHAVPQPVPSKVAANGECAVRYFLVLTGTIDEVDEPKLRALVSHIRKLSGDADLTLEAIKAGSIILHFRGTAAGLRRLHEAYQSGQLREVIGYPLERIKEDRSEDDAPSSGAKLQHLTHQSDDLVSAPLMEKSPLGSAQLVPIGRRRLGLLPATVGLLLMSALAGVGQHKYLTSSKGGRSSYLASNSPSKSIRSWRIRSLPTGVEVRDALTGRVLGQTPLVYKAPLSDQAVLSLSRPGYEERRLTLQHDDLGLVIVKLRRSRR